MPCDHGYPPLTFDPIFKEKIWGGRSLSAKLRKKLPDNCLVGESWEISGVAGNESVVRSDSRVPETLPELLRRMGRDLVGPLSGLDSFPLLYKFIDAQSDLSIQLHPSDEQALAFGLGSNGKTECWYIIDAPEDTYVICGLKAGVTVSDVKAALEANHLPALCNYISIKPGDVIFVPPGTVHATLANTLLYEVQQTSDVTFRLYDWKRIDSNGIPRQLHIGRALQTLDISIPSDRGIEPVVLRDGDYYHAMRMACRYFALEEYRFIKSARLSLSRRQSFQVLTVICGAVEIETGSSGLRTYTMGETVLVPAVAEPCHCIAEAGTTVLNSYIPHILADIISPLRKSGVSEDQIEQLGGASRARNDVAAALKQSVR